MFHILSRRPISLKFIIFNPSNRNPFTPSSFRFSSASTTPQNPSLVVDFFKSHGFSESKTLAILQSFSFLLRSNTNKTLQPKIDFLKSKGFSISEIRRIIASNPNILRRSLEKEIIPTFDFFSNIFLSEQRMLMKTVLRYSGILFDLDKISLPNIRLLREQGVPESNVIKFINYFPRPLKIAPKLFAESVLQVKQLGFNPLKSQFFPAVAIKAGFSKSGWARKEGVYKKWGWSDDHIVAAFRLYPLCMAISEKKIEAIMDFLVNELGFESCDLARCPMVLSMSLEKRINPRGSVVLFLLSKGLVKKMNLRVSSIFIVDEKSFLKRFVFHHEGEADELLKLYQAKLSLAR